MAPKKSAEVKAAATEQNFKIKPPKSAEEIKKQKRKKRAIIITVILAILLAAGATIAYFIFFAKPTVEEEAPKEEVVETPKIYSKLSGLEIADESVNSMPTYCIQIPNGADGARPQTGLDEAAVVFEAIAEAGITRFAAVFQNPQSEAIGPIRSLRTYYLDWDTPFDCTIVHAGGSTEAAAALVSGNYTHLNESYTYMWRDTSSYWAPNNLMTSSTLLANFAADEGVHTASPAVFPRLAPAEVAKILKDNAVNNTSSTEDGTTESAAETADSALVSEISVNFGSVSDFNTVYKYDAESNTYLRSYASGEEHLVYSCANVDKARPTPKSDCGLAKQVAPSAIAVMKVDEYLDTDGYHHVIKTIGTGTAYIFQNGTAVEGTWKKISKSAQIEFTDKAGNTISFTPGQLWIAAVPNSGGSVKY